MSIGILIARFLHILFGVFWAGTFIFLALFLSPSIAEAGPDGAKVMAGVQRRGFMHIMPVVALVTIFSGLWLFWHASSGFNPGWMHSPIGMGYSVGALFALVAFAIGMTVTRPATMAIGDLTAKLSQTTDAAERESLARELGAVRRRSTTGARLVALFLALATILMGVARYL